MYHSEHQVNYLLYCSCGNAVQTFQFNVHLNCITIRRLSVDDYLFDLLEILSELTGVYMRDKR